MKLRSLMLITTAGLAALPFASLSAEDAAVPATTVAPAAAPDPSAAPAAVPQAAAAPQPAAVPACELHVFPTLEGQAMTTGWLSGFGAIGAIADATANKDRNVSDAAYLKEALGPRLQVEALKSMDIAAMLKLPPSQVIYETAIADRKITTKATTRLSSSTASCYAELIVTENLYVKRAIYGRSLNNRFVFKNFRDGKTSAELVKGRGGNGLTSFPPQTTDQTEAAEKDLRTAFAANFAEFAKTVGAPR